MNNSRQLKNSLISRIEKSNDLDFLRALQTIFDSAEQSLFQLNATQKESIEISRQEIQSGDVKSDKQIMTEVKAWLGKK